MLRSALRASLFSTTATRVVRSNTLYGATAAAPAAPLKKVSINALRQKFQTKTPIAVITAYDFPTASLVQESGADILLVGDSLAMVVLGHENTRSVTMNDMIHHCKAVNRGAKRPFLVGDVTAPSLSLSLFALS